MVFAHRFYCYKVPPFYRRLLPQERRQGVLRPRVSQHPGKGFRVSSAGLLCTGYSVKKTVVLSDEIRRTKAFGPQSHEPLGNSVAAWAGSRQRFTELLQWSTAGGSSRWDSDGLLGKETVSHRHTAGND